MAEAGTKRRKVLAILAGGLVVGVGTAVTLAAWNDSEFATGTFAAGTFNLEGSLDDTTYAEHSDAASAQQLDSVQFVADTSNMVPDEVAYDSFFVRLDDATSIDGSLALAGTTATGDAAQYGYVVAAIDPAAVCDATTIAAGTVLGEGASLDANTASGTVTLAHGDGAPGASVQLCFAVTAGADLEQGATATTTWEFEATSDDAT
ncbi:SipW-dependent-type signal peptide-containing protein [Microbacterium halophytorum]|uniref:SipW-dependent-type signal peptide-containing protein n=1 Tax=Microbacterium halophytorum TaxID=2067568 RepID=UPI000CFCB164|nr:SipW-dependent-type signal peptide-containing protein [Microbacterium halophytorum]